jgi:hypothetical protein
MAFVYNYEIDGGVSYRHFSELEFQLFELVEQICGFVIEQKTIDAFEGPIDWKICIPNLKIVGYGKTQEIAIRKIISFIKIEADAKALKHIDDFLN